MAVPHSKLATPVQRARAVIALEEYFVWSLGMQQAALHGARPDPRSGRSRLPFGRKVTAETGYLAHWFAALHVVVEGWQELGLTDPAVDRLLRAQGKKAALRRFRNVVYHYQVRGLEDRRITPVIRNSSRIKWAAQLSNEFIRVFRSLPRRRSAVHDWIGSHSSAPSV